MPSSRRTSSRTSTLAATSSIHAAVPARAAARRDRHPVLDRRDLHRELGDGAEVDTDRSVAYGANRQCGREEHVITGLAEDHAEPHGHVDVGGMDDVSLVEGAQQPGCPEGEAPVTTVAFEQRLGHDAAPAALSPVTRPSSRSESSTTMAAGGRQENTPQGFPSTSGVSGPHMPRR